MNNELPNAKFHVFLVEDNPGDVGLLRLALQDAQLDCELTVVPDGAQALQFVREQDSGTRALPDLAILDLNVPKNDGLDVLEAIRTSARLGSMPVVMLTSSSSPRDAARIHRFGISRHISKPADLEAFMRIGQVIREVLTKPESRVLS